MVHHRLNMKNFIRKVVDFVLKNFRHTSDISILGRLLKKPLRGGYQLTGVEYGYTINWNPLKFYDMIWSEKRDTSRRILFFCQLL